MSGVSLNTSPTCSICWEPLSEEVQTVKKENFEVKDLNLAQDGTPTQVKCGHVFHANCIHNWVKEFCNKTKPPTCPTCRVELAEPFATPPPPSATGDLPAGADFAESMQSIYEHSIVFSQRIEAAPLSPEQILREEERRAEELRTLLNIFLPARKTSAFI